MKLNRFLLLFFIIFLFACTQKENIVGSWALDSLQTSTDSLSAKDMYNPLYEFKSNHVYIAKASETVILGNWDIKNNKLILTFKDAPEKNLEAEIVKNEENELVYKTGEGENQTIVTLIKLGDEGVEEND